ncbi:MAG: lytic transglycosylase domain-containing protein, partial [Alphaproteobacteria bacterium]
RYGDAETALAYEARSVFDDIEIQAQYARIAGEIYYDGTIEEAYRRALNVINAVQHEVPYAYWIAGLCAWRNQDYSAAARLFTGYSEGYSATRWEKAAGHFWAARAHGKMGQASSKRSSLEKAAKYHETLYGLLARRLMGWDTKSHVQGYKPSKSDINRLLTWKAGKRGFALYQVGEFRRAEKELMQIARKKEKALRRTLLRIAEAGNMPELSVRLAHYRTVNDKTHDYRGLYPIPAYKPKGGFTIDRALMFGIMKKESMFNPRLNSSAGARGLLQVYPPSSKWMVKEGMVKPHTLGDLLIPEINLAIGQRYLKYLLREHKSVKGDLVRFLIGYNAGPNRIKRWEKRARHGGDPLLYFESIPARETRAYVERTLSYIWRYRDRMGQSLQEADQLANGQWPKYIRMD